MQLMFDTAIPFQRQKTEQESPVSIYRLKRSELLHPDQFDYRYFVGCTRNTAIRQDGELCFLDPTMIIPIDLARTLTFESLKHLFIIRFSHEWLDDQMSKFTSDHIFLKDIGYIYRLSAESYLNVLSHLNGKGPRSVFQYEDTREYSSFSRMLNSVAKQYDAYQAQYIGRKHLRLANKAIQHIQSCVHSKLSTDGLSESLNTSKFHLSRLFRGITGLSISQYHSQVKLHHVLTEVCEKLDRPIELIADDFSYASNSHLTTSFKRYFNCVPREARRMLISR